MLYLSQQCSPRLSSFISSFIASNRSSQSQLQLNHKNVTMLLLQAALWVLLLDFVSGQIFTPPSIPSIPAIATIGENNGLAIASSATGQDNNHMRLCFESSADNYYSSC
jgi:hypothetical protein